MYERLIRKFQTGTPFVKRMLWRYVGDPNPHISAAPFIGPFRVGPAVHLCRHGAA